MSAERTARAALPVAGPGDAQDAAAPGGGRWIRFLGGLVGRRRLDLATTFGAALVGMVATTASPLVMRVIVDDAVLADRRPIGPWLGLLGALGVVRFVAGFVRRYGASRLAAGVDHDLRAAIHDHLQQLDFMRHDRLNTGQLVSRANTDVSVVQRLLSFLPFMSSNLLMIPLTVAAMVSLSVPLTAVALAVVPVFGWLTLRLRRVVYPASWDASHKAAAVAGVVEEAVTGVRVVKGFGQERRELDRLVEAAGELYGSAVRNVDITARRRATLQTVPVIGQAAVLAVGGWLALDGRLTVGTFLAFLTYLAQLIGPLGMMAGFAVMAQTARASVDRITEILALRPEVDERPDATDPGECRGGVDLEDVTFGYLRSAPVLAGVTLRIRPGERVALVGPSGSGKSTLAMLIGRFYDPGAGVVRIDGHDLRDVRLGWIRRNVGMVFEDTFLFSDTVRANIAFGRPDATDAEIVAAAVAAGADGFIRDLPDGYGTVVGERGITLSGGQRQRIALARALLYEPRILVLDDATSSVDVAVEADIHRALRRLGADRTVIVVAHRRSSLELAERIVVLDGGRVVDDGTHAELMDRCDLYRRMVSDEDLDAAGGDPPPAGWPRPVSGRVTAPGSEPGPAVGSSPGAGRRSGPPGPVAGGRAGVAGWALGRTPAELEAAIAALGPADERPDLDVDAETADRGGLWLPELLSSQRRALVGAVLLVSASGLAGLAGPAIVRWGVDHGILGQRPGQLAAAVGAFVGVALLGRWLSWWSAMHTGRIGQRLLYALRLRVFAHLQRLGVDYYDRQMSGRILTRMTSDIEAVNGLLQTGLIQPVVQAVTFAGAVAILVSMNATLAGWLLTVVPPLAVASVVYRSASSRAYREVRTRLSATNAALAESVAGVRVTHAFGRQDRNRRTFAALNGDLLAARLHSQRIAALYFPFVDLLAVTANVIVLGVGAGAVRAGSLTPGALIAFSLYVTVVFNPVQQLSAVFDTYQQAGAALAKLRELLSTRPSVPPPARPVAVEGIRGAIRLERVRYRYPGASADAVAGVDLDIPAGQTVALVGSTGAGKSTLVKLIARFADPTAGRVLVDGVPLVDVDPVAYRQRLGYVPQEPFLFADTIGANIAYGRPDASAAEIRDAARAVGADGFISALPDGYDTVVTERGRSLSAGQRQLIALARALLVDPAILLLDEATANLDLATEAAVNRAMGVVSSGRTTILVAHRLATAHRADRVVVIGAGRVVEDGPPAVLAAGDGPYARLWRRWATTGVPA